MGRERVMMVLLGLTLVGCKRHEEGEPAAAPRAVKCAEVQVRTVKDALEIRGTVAPPPDKDVLVAPQVAGRLVSVDVREGDGVKSGQVVARVDDAPLLDAARQSDAALARARAEHENAQTTLARVRDVFERGIAARQEVDDAAAKEASARASETEATASARQARRQIERATIRSPLDGVVLKVLRKPGELVDGTAGTAVVEIADLADLELVADVPAQDLVRLVRGEPAAVTFPALPGRHFDALVSRVASSVDRTTGVGSARLAIESTDPPRPPVGSFGVARVESGQSRQALTVIAASVRSVAGGEGEVVVCGGDHMAHVRRVRLGSARDGLVEVMGELKPGELVVSEAVLGLSEGDAIEARP
jgi:RND family efflux transporter MFP subunit